MTSAVQTTYSVKVNTAIAEYNKHIGALAKTYRSIEGAKGHWHVRWDNYKAGKFPPTAEELDSTLNKELETYESLAKATEQSKTLLALFRKTIEFCTRPRINPSDYETLERSGYKITPSLEGEDLLPEICRHLENLYERIDIIKLHMTDRLPKAAANLNGVFQEVFKHRQEVTWTDSAKNFVFNNYLEKALEKKRASEETPTIDSNVGSEEPKSAYATTPEQELKALGEVRSKLQTLTSKDPLTESSNTEPTANTANTAILFGQTDNQNQFNWLNSAQQQLESFSPQELHKWNQQPSAQQKKNPEAAKKPTNTK